jgi:hypothetical protein
MSSHKIMSSHKFLLTALVADNLGYVASFITFGNQPSIYDGDDLDDNPGRHLAWLDWRDGRVCVVRSEDDTEEGSDRVLSALSGKEWGLLDDMMRSYLSPTFAEHERTWEESLRRYRAAGEGDDA